MPSIQEFMTQHHKVCDDLLVEAESALASKDWSAFAELWSKFETETLHHFAMEEQVLFPEFEAQTGMTAGPTMVMRQEHAQINAMFEQMKAAIEQQDQERAMGCSESIMIFIQQHNMKEEQILYPMTDNHLSNSAEIVEKMSTH
ncbi:hemerythrin domain-containing protein [Vibrio hangzhouensis]|uniref:Hemerythrin HHE cation binding domain-containing protein n=1 Tax=Vibrio hangzhouensis TaxID=462991 RepID=A0A1H6BQI6_9VIBR|nr:hemerythrin domain-containing protein [Vibrio hangzhouensis]SEG62715.1 Hemerythrin HHE cation binding domain-containing protein [Vibrio hangzhouensis]